jgi:transposase-like protein
MSPLYLFRMGDRDSKRYLENRYYLDVSPDLIGRVSDAVIEDAREWRKRQLEKSSTIGYLDGVRGGL